MVISPSAQPPIHSAVSADSAAPTSIGGRPGSEYSFAPSTVTSPRCVTVAPLHSARITFAHSNSRALRSSFAGHLPPVMLSLSASPLPTATQNLPAYISANVAHAWAVTAGWYRYPGTVTTPIDRFVASSADPSHDHA